MFLFLAIVITVFVILFAGLNQVDLPLMLMHKGSEFRISFFVASVVIYFLGILSGVLVMLRAIIKTSTQCKKTARQLEKTSVGADDSELRVKTLENKIATLESALDKALKDKEEE